MKKIYLVYLLVILVLGCETNPPNTWEPEPEYGRVFVSSNIDSCEIFVDDKSTGYFSPDTLSLETGQHTIRLSKNEYFPASDEVKVEANSIINLTINLVKYGEQRVVLVEDFSNVSCNPCVVSNKILKNLKSSYTSDRVVVIKYATNFPSPIDPMYLDNPTDSKDRMTYYFILYTPTVFVNGLYKPIASDSNSIKEKIDSELLIEPKFKIDAASKIENSVVKVNGSIELRDSDGIDFDNLVLYSVVVESTIDFTSPPGSNGEKSFHDVMRKVLPKKDGYLISDIKSLNKINFEFQTEVSSKWNKDEIEVVVFVQDYKSKKVYQASLAN